MNGNLFGEPLHLDVEAFAVQHPKMNANVLLEFARGALGKYGSSPAGGRLERGPNVIDIHVHFRAPDPRSAGTLERKEFVEKGAIVVSGLALHALEGRHLSVVVGKRGSRVDYFVAGPTSEAPEAILEVGGTDEQAFASVRESKQAQLRESIYRHPPFSMEGYVSVTRFAPPLTSALDRIPAATANER